MDTQAGLLAAICSHPDDDTPRLIFADYLDENGQPERAEFIRVQCEIAKLPDCLFIPMGQELPCRASARPTVISCQPCRRFGELGKQERELWESNRREWEMSFPGTDLGPNSQLWWKRGFPDEMQVAWQAWVDRVQFACWRPGWFGGPCDWCLPGHHRGQPLSDCPTCYGTGRITRPFTGVEQPVRFVTWTDRPPTGQDANHMWIEGMPRVNKNGHYSMLGHEVAVVCAERVYWPGVRFKMPGERNVTTEEFQRITGSTISREMMRGYGITGR